MSNIAIPFALDNLKWNERKDIEFNIPYDDKRDKELDKFLDFIDQFPDVRINLEFKSGINISHLNIINKVTDNVFVRLAAQDFPKAKEMKENNIKFFGGMEYPVYSFSLLESFINLGMTDIYIADDLCYCLDDARHICDKYDIGMRTVLNRIPMTTPTRGSNPDDIIYRPNDIDYLKKYFDCFEFDCGKPYAWNKHNVLYRAFFEQKEWLGPLNEINDDVSYLLDNLTLQQDYSLYRMNCNRKCDHGRTCNKCKNMYESAQKLAKLGIVRKRFKTNSSIKMGIQQYDKINSFLSTIDKDDDKVEVYKEIFEKLDLPLVWMEANACYQLNPSVLLEEEKVGNSE